MSIQSKLTLWFTASMILLAFLMFGFLALASSSVTVRNSRSVLQRVFHEIAGEVSYDEGVLDLDDDFKTYEDNVYSILAAEDGGIISGYLPAERLMQIPFEDGQEKKVNAGGTADADSL